MNWDKYRRAVDAIPFSADFQARTIHLLRAHAQKDEPSEKENVNMKLRSFRKPAVLIAAAALLILSVSAAVLRLSPAQVAAEMGQPLLAQAFAGEDAILLDQSVETGEFTVTLLGLVSGEGLTEDWGQAIDASHTYAVVGLSRLDGAPLENETFDFSAYTLTPLVAGYSPLAVNNWTLGSSASGRAVDGSYYYLLDTQDLRIFADHTVYLAFYEGGAPSRSIFSVAGDGAISFAEGFDGVQALFTLPLDAAQADPAAAEAFVEQTGANFWDDAPAAAPQENAALIAGPSGV